MRATIAAAIIGAVAFFAGYTSHQPHTVPKTVTVVRTQDDVASFNDGWSTALSDRPMPCPSK